MSQPIHSVLVLGAGAVGGYFGARLAQAGLEVSLVARSDFEAVKKQGLQIKSYQGDFALEPAQVVRQTADYQGRPDLLLVATKVVPGDNLIEQIAPVAHPGLTVLMIQNGIDLEAPVAEAFSEVSLLSAIAFVGAGRTAPGVIHHQMRGELEIGDFPSGSAPQRLNEVVSLFERAAVPVRASRDIVQSRWKKLLWNASFNPLSVLGLADTQRILEIPQSEALVRAVMDEVMQLAQAAGHELAPDLPEKNIAITSKQPPYKTSMLLDYEAGRPLETEAILGRPLRLAKRLGISAPHLEMLEGLLHLLTDRKKEG